MTATFIRQLAESALASWGSSLRQASRPRQTPCLGVLLFGKPWPGFWLKSY